MANSYYKQHTDKSPFTDTGMVIAFAVTVVSIIKLMMYGITYVSLAWLAVTLLYVGISASTRGRSKVRIAATTVYMAVSFFAIYAVFQYDQPISPKTESLPKTDDNDELYHQMMEKEDAIVVETPKPVAVETDIVKEDASKFEEVAPPAEQEDYYEMSSDNIENSEDLDTENDNESMGPDVQIHKETISDEETTYDIDESFQ